MTSFVKKKQKKQKKTQPHTAPFNQPVSYSMLHILPHEKKSYTFYSVNKISL